MVIYSLYPYGDDANAIKWVMFLAHKHDAFNPLSSLHEEFKAKKDVASRQFEPIMEGSLKIKPSHNIVMKMVRITISLLPMLLNKMILLKEEIVLSKKWQVP